MTRIGDKPDRGRGVENKALERQKMPPGETTVGCEGMKPQWSLAQPEPRQRTMSELGE